MSYMTNTTRPVNNGDAGYTPTEEEIAAAVFEATGGGYGGGGQPRTENADAGGSGRNPSDWLTNWGNGMFFSDEMDFSKPPADRDAEIKLLAEPEVVHPLLDMFKGGFGEGDMSGVKNGGPEGTATLDEFLGALDDLIDYLWSDDKGGTASEVEFGPTNEKDPNSGLTIWKNYYTNPEADTSEVQAPSDMLADMLASKGIEGIDTSSVGVTDIMAKLSDKMGKVTEIVSAMKGAADADDLGAFSGALAKLMDMAGIDASVLTGASKMPEAFADGAFEAFGIAGGLDGIEYAEIAQDAAMARDYVEATKDASAWAIIWNDDPA